MNDITKRQYTTLQQAYDYFNEALFDGDLPQLLITLQRKSGARAYFSPGRFQRRGAAAQEFTHELGLNPDHFDDRTDLQILATVAHEMVHVWQEEFGEPSRNGYHNKQWAAKMKEAGLQPSHTGEPGSKETGQKMTHYIMGGGRFERQALLLLSDGFSLEWQSPAGLIFAAKGESDREARQQDQVHRVLTIEGLCGFLSAVNPAALASDAPTAARITSFLLGCGCVVSNHELYEYLEAPFGIQLSSRTPRLEGMHLKFLAIKADLRQATQELRDVDIDIPSAR